MTGDNSDVSHLLDRANIVEIADKLGVQLERKAANPRKALCPFHQDQSPSLNLYHARLGRDHFHCFACGAHGDAVDLVKRREGLDFWPAVQRLAEITGLELPQRNRKHVDIRTGSEILAERLRHTGASLNFDRFAARRAFEPQLLLQVGASTYDLGGLRREAETDRVLQEQLVRAGILREVDEASVQSPSLFAPGLRSFFFGERVVFPINDIGGRPVGFAARTLGNETPKYLFSYDFPRADTLYGADRALKLLTEPAARGQPAEIYIVEGLLDQLRLQSVGKIAVALLGSRMTGGQTERLMQLVRSAENAESALTFRLFLDPDEAGRKGAFDTLLALLRLLDRDALFDVDVIVPDHGEVKADPDEFLKDVSSEDAADRLNAVAVHPLRFLLAVATRQPVVTYEPDAIGRVEFARAAREIAMALPEVSWVRILAPLGAGTADFETFADLIRSYSRPSLLPIAIPAKVSGKVRPDERKDDRAALISALTMGRSSTHRREYPLDDEAWERLAIAASPFFYIHEQRLAIGDGPSAPQLARHLPKGGGRYRLKSGPTAHDALLQQYALIELLRDQPEAPDFSTFVPAVRFSEDRSHSSKLYRTGLTGTGEALSFAYQVDMAIVNGKEPPRREGIFRPYFDCWRSFIDFLDQKIRNYRHDDLQILRLDITGFYENVMRDVAADALQRPLDQALATFAKADGGPLAFAPMLRKGKGEDTAARARLFTEFLIAHSFDLKHSDPLDGELKPVNGLPQGPDLSAYLANISLFSLDDMMAKEIALLDQADQPTEGADGKCSAAYARYVDDIIIVCPTMEVAAQLRRKIEGHLQTKGLSLNHKNAIPPSMTRSQAREWVTDNRAGFGFSGPLAEMPVIEFMDPLADAGDIDRRTALGLLYDPELDDLRDPGRILARVGLALQASETRFGDKANAYRRLWQVSAREAGDASGHDVATAFWSHLSALDSPALIPDANQRIDTALACLEGLDRALRAHTPKDADNEAATLAHTTRTHLARAFLDDILSPLSRRLFEGVSDAAFLSRYDVRCQTAISASVAASLLTVPFDETSFERLLPILAPTDRNATPLPVGLRLSLQRHDGSFDRWSPLLTVASRGQLRTIFETLETSLVRLQRLDGERPDLPGNDAVSSNQTDRFDNLASSILGIWLPTDSIPSNDPIAPVELDAAATFVNVTYRHFSQLAPRRPRLLQIIAGQGGAQALPSPPGLATTGVLLWCGDGRLLFAAASEDTPKPVGVVWVPTSAPALEHLHLFQALLEAGTKPIFDGPAGTDPTVPWTPERIAQLYRSAIKQFLHLLNINTDVPVPTAFSFFEVLSPDGDGSFSVRLVCWTVPRESIDGHAFVRSGVALEARPVHAVGSDFWRFGWAVRDLCGRADQSNTAESEPDQQSDAPLDRGRQRRDAILARVLPRLSGADRWGPGKIGDGEIIPSRIRRAIALLEAFGRSEEASVHAAYLVAATAEGAFMSERLSLDPSPHIAGRPAMVAARAAWRTTRCLPPAALHWSEAKLAPLDAPYRRSGAAWFAVAQRLRVHAGTLEEEAALPMRMMVLGTEIVGVVSDLRALSFEISAVLKPDVAARLRDLALDLSSLSVHVGLEALLVEEASGVVDLALDVQVKRLFETFDAVSRSQRGGAKARDSITPLGWAVLVSTLLQITPPLPSDGELPGLWPMQPEAIAQARSALESLFPFLASIGSEVSDDDRWPWDLFEPLSQARPENLAENLRALTRSTSLRVETVEARNNPRTSETEDGRPVIRLGDGSSQRLSEWQIDVAYITGEKRTSTEFEDFLERRLYRYSISRLGSRIVGVHLVSQGLSKIAFVSPANDKSATGPDVTNDVDIPGATSSGTEYLKPDAPFSSTVDRQLPEAELRPIKPTGDSHDQQSTPPSTSDKSGTSTERTETASPAPEAAVIAHTASLEHLARTRAFQDRKWSERGKRDTIQQRLALVQWDVVETYSSPGANEGKLEGLRKLDGQPLEKANFAEGGSFLSVAEGRRRAILTQVLRACGKFGVDGLVLPEYSVRPETVNWLARQIAQLELPLTIWCGTFRVPDGTCVLTPVSPREGDQPYHAPTVSSTAGLVPLDSHTAMLTCLQGIPSSTGTTVTPFTRRKRYPSAAAGELIRPPGSDPWLPLLTSEKDPFRLGSFTVELICSEMFPHASSANFIGVLEENRRLALRYGLPVDDKADLDALTDDVRQFARWTAYRGSMTRNELNRGRSLQRTIMILPAMTSRSADYHIFGQNQYLAAGLVTAFCNAVCPGVGCGGSAFVGLDGWKRTDPVASPYGVISPGIFRLDDKTSGALGTFESAMVIVDLDPIRTADQRPRPHYQTRALELVAHLPILFSTEANSEDTSRHAADRRPRRRVINGRPQAFTEICSSIVAILENVKSSWRDERAVPNPDSLVEEKTQQLIRDILQGLKCLEAFADDAKWMSARTKAFADKRWTYSPPDYLPPLIDWLYVDDKWVLPADLVEDVDPLEDDSPLLNVPRACRAPEEKLEL